MKRQIIVAALLLSSSVAFAGTGYVGINVGSTEQKITFDGESGSDTTTGARIYGGYQVTPAFGIEAGYVHFGNISDSEDGESISFKPKAIYAAVTGTYPLSPSFNLTGKIGVARSDVTLRASFEGASASFDKTDTSAMFGIGIQYKFSDTMSLVGEYENFGKIAKFDNIRTNVKASMVSIGLRAAF